MQASFNFLILMGFKAQRYLRSHHTFNKDLKRISDDQKDLTEGI